jgi:hypothetical protein
MSLLHIVKAMCHLRYEIYEHVQYEPAPAISFHLLSPSSQASSCNECVRVSMCSYHHNKNSCVLYSTKPVQIHTFVYMCAYIISCTQNHLVMVQCGHYYTIKIILSQVIEIEIHTAAVTHTHTITHTNIIIFLYHIGISTERYTPQQ